ncbi:MAG: hypothetical protein ABF391_07730 [Akkermansiaceae bacterium]
MKSSPVILTLALVAITSVVVVRRQALNELIKEQAADTARRKDKTSSDHTSNSSRLVSNRLFNDLLESARETTNNGRDLALGLGTLPDLSQSELIDLIATLAQVSQPNPMLRQQIVSAALKLLASREPEAALALIPGLRESGNFFPRELDRATDFAIRLLATQDPFAAARWFNKHIDESDPSQIRQAILSVTAKHHPALAFDLISELNFDPTELRQAHSAIGAGLTGQSVEQIISTIRGLPPGSSDSILYNFGRGEFTKDFSASAEWLKNSMLTPEEKESILTGIKHWNIRDNPGQWLDLVASHPAATRKRSDLSVGLGQTIHDWAAADYVAAGEWLNRQEESPLKAQGVARYIDVALVREPKVAMEWLATLPTDHADRNRLAASIHRALVHDDPEAAAALAETYQLSE